MPKTALCLITMCFLIASGCTTPGVHRALQADPQAPWSFPKLLAVYMPWFGNHSHMNVGYSSNDPGVLRKQIEQARHMGISGFVVDWYGQAKPYNDHNFALLQREAAADGHFQVALLYNEDQDEDSQSTDDAINALDEAYKLYFGPAAEYRQAYLTYNGRPLFFVFPKHGKVDWNRVHEHVSGWEAPPLLIYKDEPAGDQAAAFAGSYAWVQPGGPGWTSDGSNWGRPYLEYFYKTMKNKHPDKIVVGGAWPGFDDSAAAWGLNRHMARACGKTLDETLNLYKHYYDSSNPMPFMLVETWNDYEEGTAIEKQTGENCGNNGASGAH